MKHIKEFVADQRILVVLTVFFINVVTFFATPHERGTWLALIIGFVLFYIVEYIVHRFILHGVAQKLMPKAYEGHHEHHTHPNDIEFLLTPNLYNIPSYIALIAITFLVTRNVHLTSAVFMLFSLGQLHYEWTHYISHRPIIPLTPWGKWMKKYHLLHHFKDPDAWYGVTNPSFDILAGTNKIRPTSKRTKQR